MPLGMALQLPSESSKRDPEFCRQGSAGSAEKKKRVPCVWRKGNNIKTRVEMGKQGVKDGRLEGLSVKNQPQLAAWALVQNQVTGFPSPRALFSWSWMGFSVAECQPPPLRRVLASDLPVSKGKTTSGPNMCPCLEPPRAVKSVTAPLSPVGHPVMC